MHVIRSRLSSVLHCGKECWLESFHLKTCQIFGRTLEGAEDETQKLSFLDSAEDSTSSFLFLRLLARRPEYDRASGPQEG